MTAKILKARAFMLALSADTTDFTALLYKTNNLPDTYQWAIITHDKDEGSNHYHIAIQTTTPASAQTIANHIGIAPNFVQIWRGKTANMWAYLTHNTDTATLTKAHYSDYLNDPSKFATNITDYTLFNRQNKQSNIIDALCEQILTGDLTKKQLLQPELIKTYWQYKTKIDKAIQLRTESLRYNSPKCQTILINGLSGTGKSTYAINYAKNLYKDNWAMASAGNDPLQDYTGEKCLIFDDWRPQDYSLQDLLALLDPNYRQRTHKSRYYNKPLATELIIITSTHSIDDIVNFYTGYTKEDPKQIRRRIQTIITCSPDYTYQTDKYNEQYDGYTYSL